MSSHVPIVYIVEDDVSFRTSIERLLLEVQLPTMDGLELQETLASRGVSLPMVFMTGHGSIQIGVQAMKRGAADLLPKPFDSAELEAAVLAAIDLPHAPCLRAALRWVVRFSGHSGK